MGFEAMLHPRATFDNVYNGLRTLDKEKIKQILSSVSGYDNYQAGGNRARYQGGKHSIQAGMIFLGAVKVLTEGKDVIRGAGSGMLNSKSRRMSILSAMGPQIFPITQ